MGTVLTSGLQNTVLEQGDRRPGGGGGVRDGMALLGERHTCIAHIHFGTGFLTLSLVSDFLCVESLTSWSVWCAQRLLLLLLQEAINRQMHLI